ncbi:MAG: magnesium transporter CorA family protein [bacterium]
MIEIFKTMGSMQNIITEYEKDSWINVTAPSEDEIRTLSQDLNIPVDFLTSPLDVDERPRIETEDKNTLVIIRTPHFDKDNDIQFTTVPLGIIFADNILLTVCGSKNDVLQAFINGRIRGWSTSKRSQFLLRIFSRTALIYLDYLKQINKQTSEVEDRLEKSMKNEELIELLNFEKSLVYFTTSLRANELVMERLQKTEMIKMYPDDMDLLEDVIIENRQAIEMANIHSNILSGMMDAFASVISNNLNVVMKFLTSVTILLNIPVLVASIYGMNVKLPLQDWSHAFAFTMAVSFAISILGVIVFAKRKWF